MEKHFETSVSLFRPAMNLFVQRLFLPLLALSAQSVFAEAISGFDEPPAVLYGKVIQIDEGAANAIYSGMLEIVLTSEDDPSNSITLTTELGSVDANGFFSYRLEVPQHYLPNAAQLGSTLSVDGTDQGFIFSSITIDGNLAEPLDTDAALLDLQFSNRAIEHRLDLSVEFDALDSDGDGLPDWWEEAHELNPLWAGDAELDADSDGWSNLDEFELGSDPNESNTRLSSLTSTINVIPGARTGLYLSMIDSNINPTSITGNTYGRIVELPAGVSAYYNSPYVVWEMPSVYNTIYYANQQSGYYYLEVDEDFESGSAVFQFWDSNTTTGEFTVNLVPFTPASLVANRADLWYDSENETSVVENSGAVSQWNDLAGGNDNHAYQPISGSEPSFDPLTGERVSFDGDQYLFINDTGMDFSAYTIYAAITPDTLENDDQVIFGSDAMELQLTGAASDSFASVYRVQTSGREVIGAAATGSTRVLLSYSQSSSGGLFSDLGLTYTFDHSSDLDSESTFSTLGGRYDFDASTATSFFKGDIHEFIVFPDIMDAKLKSRVDDYFIGRWHSSDYRIWDLRMETSPVVLVASSTQNVFSGGWNNDSYTGGSSVDIFRDGPGSDTLTGAGGGDVFQFFMYSGVNTIVDYDYGQGDIIDLSPIFMNATGAPDDYIQITRESTFEPGSIPTINTNLAIDYEADGQVDQTIVLAGVSFEQDDLTWLIGEGHFVIGGPAYSSAVDLTSDSSVIDELPNAYSILLSRTGNTESGLDMIVNIGGTATLDVDYGVNGLTGTGSNRTLSFARGETEATITITPVPDTFDETESIRLSVLPENGLELSEGIELTLEDAEWLIIETVQPYAERVTKVPGIVRVTRSGVSEEQMAIDLHMSGTAENGVDYAPVTSTVVFEVGETIKDIHLTPIQTGNIVGKTTVAHVSILPDTTRYNLLNPWSAAIRFVDRNQAELNDFASFAYANDEIYPPDTEDAVGALYLDFDNDSILNIAEYAWGTDPTVADDSSNYQLSIHEVDGSMHISAKTAAAPQDLEINLLYSNDLVNYENASDLFDLVLEPQSDGTILRRYVSKFPVSSSDSQFYTLSFNWIETIRSSGDFAYAVFDEDQLSRFDQDADMFFAIGDAPWVPMVEEEGVSSADIGNDESASFVTNVEGPFTLDFEWKVSSEDSFDELLLLVDDVQINKISGEVDWTSVSHSDSEEGVHRVEIRFEKDESVSSGEDRAYIRRFDVSAL